MITVFFDGLCYPKNPGGVAVYGLLIYRDGELIHKEAKPVGEGPGMTNNVAEYEGLMAAALWLKEKGIEEEIVIKGDSRLAIMQMTGAWQVRSATSRRYVPEIKRLLEGRRSVFQWIPREENEEADELCREAYRQYRTGQGQSRQVKMPFKS
jgi:ribonuclease HI